jgi:hypothetical protein
MAAHIPGHINGAPAAASPPTRSHTDSFFTIALRGRPTDTQEAIMNITLAEPTVSAPVHRHPGWAVPAVLVARHWPSRGRTSLSIR